ncbi:hypothetical protein HDU93_004113, partial [Gonapodya sp. JEL0774]
MTVESSDIPFGGFVLPGFEAVEAAFRQNFVDGKEVGAAYSAYVDGKEVARLWGGWADKERSRPFTDDTMTVIFSSGKAVQGVTVAHCVSKGLFAYDDLVSKYWPEFAEGGKGHVRIRDLCHHTAGVPFLDADHKPTISELSDLDAMARKIAGQPHEYGGEYKKCYHGLTQGWYLNEVIRRTLGKSHGQFIREVVNPALGTDIYPGFPVDDPAMEARFSGVIQSDKYKKFEESLGVPEPGSLRAKYTATRMAEFEGANAKDIRKAESPAAYTVSNAKS